jgi:hypothetical protein
MLNELECEEVMDLLTYAFPADSLIHKHLTQLHRERDIQLYWNLHQLNYWRGNDAAVTQRLREMI